MGNAVKLRNIYCRCSDTSESANGLIGIGARL